jgi:hypothetical protein
MDCSDIQIIQTHLLAKSFTSVEFELVSTWLYPFGMQMPGRMYAAADAYRYGFMVRKTTMKSRGKEISRTMGCGSMIHG